MAAAAQGGDIACQEVAVDKVRSDAQSERLAELSARRTALTIPGASREARKTASHDPAVVSFLVSYIQVHRRPLPCIEDR
jgi:hypothetical protein